MCKDLEMAAKIPYKLQACTTVIQLYMWLRLACVLHFSTTTQIFRQLVLDTWVHVNGT